MEVSKTSNSIRGGDLSLAIMQPYFFPYIGYFQLIHDVDKYINLDHVSFMKRSYMCRNEIKNGINSKIKVLPDNKVEISEERSFELDPEIINFTFFCSK